jgi:hypothetical protein
VWIYTQSNITNICGVLRERYEHYLFRWFFQEFPCVGCFLILCVLALTRLISRHRNCHWLGLRKSWNRTKKSRYSFPFQWISIFHVLAQLWSNIPKFLASRAWENEGFPWGSLTAHSSAALNATIPTLPLFEMAESTCSPFCYILHYLLFIKFISAFYHVCVTGQLL